MQPNHVGSLGSTTLKHTSTNWPVMELADMIPYSVAIHGAPSNQRALLGQMQPDSPHCQKEIKLSKN